MKISELKPLEKNPFKPKDKELIKLINSILAFPKMMFKRRIIIDEDKNILGGNKRVFALKKILSYSKEELQNKLTELNKLENLEFFANIKKDATEIIEFFTDLTEDEKKEFIVKDNVGFGKWDFDLLEEWGVDFEAWGVEFEEFESKEPEILETEDDDKIPEEPKNIFVVNGDIFEIKANGVVLRVGCLDSTNVDDIEKLTLKNKIDLVLSDPPYGISVVTNNKVVGGGETKFGVVGGGGGATRKGKNKFVDSKHYEEIKGDETTETAKEFYNTCISLDFKNIILWGGNYYTDFTSVSRCWIVWNKKMTGNFADAELAWTSFNSGVKLYDWLWNGLSREGNRIDELNTRIHPTQKPVGLHENILLDYSKQNDNIFDGFTGSGTTAVACLKTKRNCFTNDISENYVQISVKRIIDFCEKNNFKYEITLNGESFDTTKLENE